MKTINSQAVRNEVFNMQTQQVSNPPVKQAGKDRAVIIGFIIAMASTLVILGSLGLIPKY